MWKYVGVDIDDASWIMVLGGVDTVFFSSDKMGNGKGYRRWVCSEIQN